MNLKESYASREEFMKAMEEAMEEDGQSGYYLPELKEKADRYAQEVEQSKKYRNRAQEAENRLAELESKLQTQAAAFDELSKINPGELQEKLKILTKEKAELSVKLEQIQALLEPLQKENESFRQCENLRIITDALLEEAKTAGIRSEAFRDVRRLAGLFSIKPDGTIISNDGLSVHELLEREKSVSPHWLPLSVGGGSTPGHFTIDDKSVYSQAKQSGDIGAMIAAAPLVE